MATRSTFVAVVAVALLLGCDLSNSVAQRPHGPSKVLTGPLVLSAWLPAGIEDFRFTETDQQRLADLGLTHIQWLQRAEQDGQSAEALAMAFASRQGLNLPVYFEPPGYSPYDKLRNWATMSSVSDSFDAAVAARARDLHAHWAAAPAFSGYLIGHEDYRAGTYDALARTVAALRTVDPLRPAISVGAIGSYPKTERFLAALFVDGGEPNVFQHEHYVFEADVAPGGSESLRRLRHLVGGYDKAAGHLRDRHGRWHAIIQVHSESRDGKLWYRQPTAAEISVQTALALSRGASGIVYFLYSSGIEQVRNGQGDVVQVREYVGLVDVAGAPTAAWTAVQQLNGRLQTLSTVLADRAFRGGYEARRAPADEPVASQAADVDLAFFGTTNSSSHVLVVNRRTDSERNIVVELAAGVRLVDVEAADTPTVVPDITVSPGGFRLFEVIR